MAKIAARHRLSHVSITEEGEAKLLGRTWPGNIRELSHELERAVIFGGDCPLDFAYLDRPVVRSVGWRNPAWHLPSAGFVLDSVVNDLIAEALHATNNNVSAAARRLGVNRDFLRYRVSGPKLGSA